MEEQLAKCIQRAVQLREESYDKAAAEVDTQNDVDQYYQLSMWEAADKACEEIGFDLRMTPLMAMMISHMWNQSQEWADLVLDDAPESAFKLTTHRHNE